MPTKKKRFCLRCEKELFNRNSNAKYCKPCARVVQLEDNKKYRVPKKIRFCVWCGKQLFGNKSKYCTPCSFLALAEARRRYDFKKRMRIRVNRVGRPCEVEQR